MEYFFYCRDHSGTEALRVRLLEEHWAFMDNYVEGMIARGPTLGADGESATGSVHIVDLPDERAAHVFAFQEPNYRGGVYRDVQISRWRGRYGTTMWKFTTATPDLARYLVLGHVTPTMAGHDSGFAQPVPIDHIIVGGYLLSADGTHRTGTAALVEAQSDAAAAAFLSPTHDDIEVHRWQFGGRRPT